MKKTCVCIILFLYFFNVQSQTYSSVADSLRQNGIKRIASFQIDEVDSVQFFRKPDTSRYNFLEMRTSFFYKQDGTSQRSYKGRLIDVFAELIDKPRAYLKTRGVVSNVLIHCTMGLRKFECDNAKYSTHIIDILERYYSCRLEKARDSLEVFVIRKENPKKLCPFKRPEKPDSWIDAIDGRLLYQQFVGRLEGEDVATLTSHLAYSYNEIFVLAEEDKLDDNKYYLIMEAKQGKNINDAYKELKDNGLSLTKEKKMVEFFQLTFF
jgi:hypothetical protein